jgi:protoporphyrinogen oxidase
MSRPAVGIVGGGILGLTAAYRLLQQGVHVTLFERSNDLGGLVGSFDFDGYPTDRFYHVILPTDDRVRSLAGDVGLGDDFQFRPTLTGFYDDERLFSMSTLREFATFPLLAPQDRVRLALFVMRCQRTKNGDSLDDVPLLDWLRRTCGKRTVERLWAPLLDSKFDGRYDDMPATYLWARTKRMSKTRDSAGRELMGWLNGGYQRLVDALAANIRELGGVIHSGVAVSAIAGSSRGIDGIVVDGSVQPFDHVLCTLLPPQAQKLLPEDVSALVPDHCRYLGVICVIARVDHSVSPYYTLNITDRRVPLTTVVETTHVVDPEFAGGHLLYAAKYVDPSHDDLARPVADVERDYLAHTARIFPSLESSAIQAVSVQRARMVEPVHTLGGRQRIPDMFPVRGLALASTAHVYPEVVNGQAVIGVADRAVAGLLERLTTPRLLRAVA